MKRHFINQKDFEGDITFFDNRFCYTSGNPHYERMTMFPKSNEIIATRLIDYQSPSRTDYIYIKRICSEDCCFEVDLTIPQIAHADGFSHRYFKMEGDFKSDTLQNFEFVFSGGGSVCAGVTEKGEIVAEDKKTNTVIKPSQWFHLLWAINLENQSIDIYVDGNKIISSEFKENIDSLKKFTLRLLADDVLGDLYVDNFNVTGLIKPIVDGIEIKTAVIPNDYNIKNFMSDKIGMHAYGNVLCKNGTKTKMAKKGIYRKREEQYYVNADTLNSAFDLDLKADGDIISGSVTISKSGMVKSADKSFLLEYSPIFKNGEMYIPVKQFARDALGKHVWWFKTGIMLFTDYELNLNADNWEYQSTRVNAQCTIWNDIDYLNGYLQYIRPDSRQLKKDYIDLKGDSSLSSHPRIYYNSADFALMKSRYLENRDVMYTKRINEFIAEADKYIDSEDFITYTFQDKMRQFNCVSKALGDRFKAWGIAYYITGDEKYVCAAQKQFEIAQTFPDFNTAHIIDTGEAAISLAIGYDWFYNAFTPDIRKKALYVVRKKCLDVLASGLYGRITSSSDGAIEWRSFKWMSNYNVIVNAGVTVAAIATFEYESDEAFRYIADALRSIEYTMQMFTPGGSWNEGPNYWDFTMRYLVSFAANMEKTFGTSYNIMDGQGVADTLNFIIACIGTVGTNNMGDGNMTETFSFDSFFYLAKRYKNPVAAFMRHQDLISGNAKFNFPDVVFYDFNAGKIDNSVFDNVSKIQRIDGMDLFSIRDTYLRKDSKLYFSAHFGTTSGYHQHYDCGTFVLDLMGERWAYDLGSDSYLLQNELGYPVYAIYRKRAEAHNMLVINPCAYTDRIETENGNFAPILDAKANDKCGFVYADMSKVYIDAPKMILGYYIGDNMSSVTMRNEFTLNVGRKCMWTMNTKGEIKIDGNVAYVSRNGKTIKLEFICTGNKAMWHNAGNPKPLPTSPQCPEQNKNEEFTQLKLTFNMPQGENKLIIKISYIGKNVTPIDDVTFREWKLK